MVKCHCFLGRHSLQVEIMFLIVQDPSHPNQSWDFHPPSSISFIAPKRGQYGEIVYLLPPDLVISGGDSWHCSSILWLRGTGIEPVSWLRVLDETTNSGGCTSEFIVMWHNTFALCASLNGASCSKNMYKLWIKKWVFMNKTLNLLKADLILSWTWTV